MATSTADLQNSLEQQRLQPLYLAQTRQRFKAEVNRLTGGGMHALLRQQPDAPQLAFLMSYLYIYHWLRQHVHADYRALLLQGFSKGKQGFLMELLLQPTPQQFVRGYLEHWLQADHASVVQAAEVAQLLHSSGGDVDALQQRIESIWRELKLFSQAQTLIYKDLARDERERYDGMLGAEDQQRLALVDALPDPAGLPQQYDKLGLIPAMGCPQTCRHCMFIFRPLMKNVEDPQALMDQVNALTQSVLFTGGDLTKQLDYFYQAIASMDRISTFAILLNGDFANDRDVTRQILENMAKAVRRRPLHWARAKVMLQISFDEFHQEVMVDKHGQLKERIAVSKIANIVEAAPKFSNEIQLCLLHKQHALNFSMELFQKGVFARLAEELGRRGQQVQVLSATPSKRLKRNPLNPAQRAPVIKDAAFILTRYPSVPILFTSSTIDAYGRASAMDETEAVRERDLLQQVLEGDTAHGEVFDKDIMFWFNGWATLFSAVHMCLGNVHEEGLETILKRREKDPLSNAMHRFDLRLLQYYREKADDLDAIIETSTSPYHLFHSITESAAMRLHMTQRLLQTTATA